MRIVTDTADLAEVCTQLASETFITVDTEFMRESTFWPELCLIQIAGESLEILIDPLAGKLDLTPFFVLMARENVLKVFHAARQDIEIIHYLGKVIPHPVFDTQVAAMVCGFGDQIGYEALARRLANARIDKSSRFTDWSRRPLSDKQLAYALSDVTHLRLIYQKLKQQLDKSDRESWLSEEMDVLTSPDTYASHPENAYKRIKFRARNKRQLAVLQAVAAWRETEAQQRNVPRNRVLKDDALAELAVQAPRDQTALTRLRAMPRGIAQGRLATAVLAAVKQGQNSDVDHLPDISKGFAEIPEGTGAKADILKLALKVVSEREGIASKLICGAAELEKLAAGTNGNGAIMKGWRYQVFGQVAEKLLNGNLVIGIQDGKADIFTPPGGETTRTRQAAE